MQFSFPETKFTDIGIIAQIDKIHEELTEALEAALTPDDNRMAEEIFDLLQSVETALRILEKFHGVNLSEVRRAVERKNLLRNYYT